jgi:mannose-6-phosphate isomerase-like protein (cupin superfamily)
MSRRLFSLAIAVVLTASAACSRSHADERRTGEARLNDQGQEVLRWGPPPASLPPGARMALVQGDPRMPGPFTVRFRLPDGFTVPPHFHPADEHVRVIRGEYGHGFGDVVDTTRMRWLRPGQTAVLPARSHHYTRARGSTETEISGMGPFTVRYVGR